MTRDESTSAVSGPAAPASAGPRAIIFNIQRYSIHDGPGIRTTVFLKGCPLRCEWCHNPEAISARPEFGFFPERCIGCLECVTACPHGVHASENGHRVLHRELCQGEGRCVDVCYAEALEKLGYEIDVAEAVARAERDRPFYETSNGGVTISGGEPLRQIEFTVDFLARCQALGLHTALDTCGYAPWTALDAAARHADLVLYELKHMDSERHRAITGVPNELILANLSRLIETRGTRGVWIRYPFIPTRNDEPANCAALALFLGERVGKRVGEPALRVDLLPYHALGQSKYRKLGRAYALDGLQPPTSAELDKAAAVLAGVGLDVHVGG